MNWKLTIWHVVVLILALLFWGYGSSVSSDVLFGQAFDGLAVFYLILLLTFTAMGVAFFQRKVWALSLTGIIGLIYLFQFGFSLLNLFGVGILMLLGLYSCANSGTEISQRTKINIRRVVQSGAWPIVLGLFILVSFAVYQSPMVQNLKNANSLPSQSETFIKSIVQNIVSRETKKLNAKESQNIITQVSQKAIGDLNLFFRPYLKYTPPILAFGLFLILWGLSWIFIWLSVLLGMLIFWILKKTKVVSIEERDIKAEVLIL